MRAGQVGDADRQEHDHCREKESDHQKYQDRQVL